MGETDRWRTLSKIEITPAIVIALAGLVATPSHASAPTATPLQPATPWVLEGEKGECLLQRTYSAGKPTLTMALRQDPYGDELALLIVGKGGLPLGIGSGHVMLSPSGRNFKTDVLGDRLSDGRIADRISSNGDVPPPFEIWNGVQAITVTVGHFSRSMATPGLDQALKALKNCNRMLIQSWGLDPDERKHIKVDAKPLGEPQNWIASSDYPTSAVYEGLQGNTRVLYTIGVDGRATDCRAVVSSGNKELDASACRSIIANARFDPAQDSTGRAVASHRVDTIAWRIGL
jgi:TonB family protein